MSNKPAAQFIDLRSIARALERKLNETPEHDVHWISVLGEDSMRLDPTLFWDQKLADSLLQVSVSDGFSEGTLMYVHAQRDRYKHSDLRAVFMIKLLCGTDQAFRAAADTFKFLRSPEFEAMTAPKEASARAQDDAAEAEAVRSPAPRG